MDVLRYGDKGQKVRELQHLLNHNELYKPRRKLVEDGEFGTLTAAACQKAKYWLGYKTGNIEPVAGLQMITLLEGSVPLTAEMLARRKARLHPKPNLAREMRLRALSIIKGELGTLEKPNNSNHIKYNDWWGWGAVPYCVIGVSWAWVRAGSKAFVKGSRWAGTDLMLANAKTGSNGIHLTNDPDPGCPGVIDFDGHSDPDHAITFVRDNGDGTCETYEFNTSKDGTYIQGVWKKDRPLRNCWWIEPER